MDGNGRTIRLLGVNRSGTEYACQQGYGFFDGPSDPASIRVMESWRINAVRVPLNETCWLGINGIDPAYGGAAYRGDRSVLFDLYNEPHDIGWRCWQRGCEVHDPRVGGYRAAGMAELVRAVRSTGARQPLLLGGIGWSRNLNHWLGHLPPDPLGGEVASNHTYNFAACFRVCRRDLARDRPAPPGRHR